MQHLEKERYTRNALPDRPIWLPKIVSVVKGEIIDVIVGVGGASNERNKGKFFSVNLSDRNRKSIFIPDGYAHGFLVFSEEAVVVYHQTNHFDATSDTGTHFDSFGFQWRVQSPIISEKTQRLPGLNEVFYCTQRIIRPGTLLEQNMAKDGALMNALKILQTAP